MDIGERLDFIRRFDPEAAERLERLLRKKGFLMEGNVYGERFTERQFLLIFQTLLDTAAEQARILESLTGRKATVVDLSGLLKLDPARVFSHMRELVRRNMVGIEAYDGQDPVYGRRT